MVISNRYPAEDHQGAHKPNSRPVDFYEPIGDEDEEPPVVSGVQLNRVASFASSTGSLDPEVLVAEQFGSEDLDKLSNCLSEASSEAPESSQGNSLLCDIIQAQLALWTLVFSILYSYAWQQHRKKFLLSLFFVVPTVFAVCCGISTLLTAIVVLGRIFSTPVVYTDFLKCEDDPTTGQTSYPRRHRTYSGTSCRSSLSIRSATSAEDVHLPVPLCRRHSSSNGSINGSILLDQLPTTTVTAAQRRQPLFYRDDSLTMAVE